MLENESSKPPGAYGSQIDKALALIPDAAGEEDLDDHVRWELGEVLGRLRMEDLSTREAMALLALLAPIHSRAIRRRRLSAETKGPPVAVLHLLKT